MPSKSHADLAADAKEDAKRFEFVATHALRCLEKLVDWAGRGFPPSTIPEALVEGGDDESSWRPPGASIEGDGFDPGERMYAQYREAMVEAHLAIGRLYGIASEIVDPSREGVGAAGCRSCARLRVPKDPTAERSPVEPWWRPVEVPDQGLCRWCWGFKIDMGELPAIPLLRIRWEGGRITTARISEHMPHLPRQLVERRAPARH